MVDIMDSDCLDNRLQLVADRDRRMLLHALRHEANGKAQIDDLVDQLLEDGPATEPPSDRSQLTTQLYHAHLPKLADHGVVEYDHEEGTIEYQPDGQLEAVLASLPDEMPAASP